MNYFKKENARIEEVNTKLYKEQGDLKEYATSCGSAKCADEKSKLLRKLGMEERASIAQDNLLTEAYESKRAAERKAEALQRQFDRLTLQQNGKQYRTEGMLTRSVRTESTTD